MSDIIVVSGLDDLSSDLDHLAAQIVTETFTEALVAGAKQFESALIARTPVATEETTSAKEYGRLRDDIATEVTLGHLGGRARVGFGQTGFVARILEYGREGVPPNPFIREAAQDAEDAAVEAFAETLTR